MSPQCHHFNLRSAHCSEPSAYWAPSPVHGVRAWHFARNLKFCCAGLGWPEHRMAFLLLWRSHDSTPSSELLPHETLKHHIQRPPVGSSPSAAEEDRGHDKTTAVLPSQSSRQGKQMPCSKRSWLCICVSRKKSDSTGKKYCVCAVLKSQEVLVALWAIRLINKAGFS